MIGESGGTVLVDLDGTVCDTRHREALLFGPGKDWDRYSLACDKDRPVPGVIRLVRELHEGGNRIVLVSGRGDIAMENTVAWLAKHGVWYDSICLRRSGDYRANEDVKAEIVIALHAQGERVILAIDDLPEVAEALFEFGVPTLLVAKNGYIAPKRKRSL